MKQGSESKTVHRPPGEIREQTQPAAADSWPTHQVSTADQSSTTQSTRRRPSDPTATQAAMPRPTAGRQSAPSPLSTVGKASSQREQPTSRRADPASTKGVRVTTPSVTAPTAAGQENEERIKTTERDSNTPTAASGSTTRIQRLRNWTADTASGFGSSDAQRAVDRSTSQPASQSASTRQPTKLVARSQPVDTATNQASERSRSEHGRAERGEPAEQANGRTTTATGPARLLRTTSTPDQSGQEPIQEPRQSGSDQPQAEAKTPNSDDVATDLVTEFERTRRQTETFGQRPTLTTASIGRRTAAVENNQRDGGMNNQPEPGRLTTSSPTATGPTATGSTASGPTRPSSGSGQAGGRTPSATEGDDSSTASRQTAAGQSQTPTGRRPRLTHEQRRVGSPRTSESSGESAPKASTGKRDRTTGSKKRATESSGQSTDDPFGAVERADSQPANGQPQGASGFGQQGNRRRRPRDGSQTERTSHRQDTQLSASEGSLSYDADVDRLVETLYRRLERKLRIERERRGR